MSRETGRQTPRFIFWIKAHSDFIPQLIELERRYRLRNI